jgi:preprotein translocase subunit SecG
LEGFLLAIHIFVCLLLIIVVLLQSGKSADLAGAFGGAGSQSTFGPRGAASIMGRMTTVLAVLFMVLTLMLMIIASRKTNVKSVLDKEEIKQEEKQESIKTPPQQDPEEEKSTDLPIE